MKPTSSDSANRNDVPPAARWAWHARTLRALHRRLLREHDEHWHDSATPADKDTHDFADTASGERERERLFATLLSEGNRLGDVEAALDRIAAGTYGICEVTGRPIPEDRLRALPWTRLCKEAAEELERKARGFS